MNTEEYNNYQMQSNLNAQESERNQDAYAPQLLEQQQQAQAVLVEQTNPSRIVNDIMLRLRGKRKLPDGREEQIGTPKMNQIGIESMWFILDSHINQNVILSHLTLEEIGKIMNGLQEDLVDDLGLNWRLYGIVNKTDLDVINNSILVNIFLALKRAEGQNEKNWLGRISLEHISGAPRVPQLSKDGFWNKFKL